jgi:hypothetical protein
MKAVRSTVTETSKESDSTSDLAIIFDLEGKGHEG